MSSSDHLTRGGLVPKSLNDYAAAALSSVDARTRDGPVVIHQSQPYLPLTNLLKEGDLLLLLTPGIPPDPRLGHNVTTDPFEPLGKALAKYHPWVRHVPYLPRNGITGTHVVHIQLAAVVIFVISGPPVNGQPSQVSMAEITRSICDHKPQVIVACCNVRELAGLDTSFPAVVQIPNHSSAELEAAADLLFGETKKPPTAPQVQNLLVSPKAWACGLWDKQYDTAAAYELWCQCLPKRFHLSQFVFQSLLCRDGYAMHYVVRESARSELIGFCAVYTTYANSDNEHLVGSIAAIIVRPSYRQRGVGLSLHKYAMTQLQKIRGVTRVQLGSTFPRLLYGLPVDNPSEEWFRRRGWPIESGNPQPGTGQEVCDWFLRFKDWPATGAMPPGLSFRPCGFDDSKAVLEIVSRESKRKDNMAWYDQYARLANTMNMQDIIVGLEGNTIVATALTYCKNVGSPVLEDLPWATTIEDDVGGVTCICIAGQYAPGRWMENCQAQELTWEMWSDERPDKAIPRSTVMIRLLDSCIRTLAGHGMRKLYVDAIRGGDQGFQELGKGSAFHGNCRYSPAAKTHVGFQKWATYREVWRDV